MTDMLSRPGARDGGPHQAPGPAQSDAIAPTKPVIISAVIGAGACLLTGLLACAAVAVVGWLAAAFGGASGAVRAGATVWLVAHKTAVNFQDAPISIAPLGLTLFLGWCLYRGGRFTARVSGAEKTQDLATAAGVLAVTYGLGALIIAVFASDGVLKLSLPSAFLGAATLALLMRHGRDPGRVRCGRRHRRRDATGSA